MSRLLRFGEEVDGYTVPVLNEREVRAAAGILFVAAFTSFMGAWYAGNFMFMKIFITAFLFDFVIRIFLNPRYAPTLVIGRFFVRKQKVEFTGAAQKRFAWALGLVLAASMFIVLVINNIVGPVNLLLCVICLTLLFFESAFGVCIGCALYNAFKRDTAQLCPGGECESFTPHRVQRIQAGHVFIVSLFLVAIAGLGISGVFAKPNRTVSPIDTSSEVVDPDCVVPDWAKSIGHEEQWKLHNGC